MQKSKVTENNDSQLIAEMVKLGFNTAIQSQKEILQFHLIYTQQKPSVDIINLEKKTSELLAKSYRIRSSFRFFK